MKNNKLIYTKTALVLGILVLLSVNISAFAVSSAYEPGIKSLEINAGETKEIVVILQNMPGPEDITAEATIIQGGDIATLLDEDATYFVPFGGKTDVNIRVTIPKSAKVGEDYTIEIAFTTVAGEDGSFGFGGGVEKVIPVVITKSPSPEINNWVYFVIIILILLIIVIAKTISKKKASKKRK